MSTDPGGPSVGVFHLVYRSRNLIPTDDRKTELGRLFSNARANNKRRAVTGALLCSGETFVQVLEGDETEVRGVFDRIAADDRHDDLAVLETGPIDARVFSRWAMAEVGEDGGADIPLIAHRDGISPAAGRRTTSEQERVLDVMRQAARTASSNDSMA